MTDEKKDKLKIPEKNSPAAEEIIPVRQEKEKSFEKQEMSRDDRIVSEELKREIEMMDLDPATKKDAEKEREKISYLGEAEKIEHLLKLAGEKGLVFAVQVAKKMNEPYLLDLLHDTLAREGFYLKIAASDDDDKKT